MRLPYLTRIDDIITTWSRMIVQYDRDFEQLDPHIEDFTLSTSTGTTVLYNAKVRPTSSVHVVPKTANAATDLANLYIDTPTQGTITFNHTNNAETDRIYRVTILGS